MKKIITVLFVFFAVSLNAQGFDPSSVSMGMKQDDPDLVASVKKANPNNVRYRSLSSSADLSELMPPVGNQGRQGSCVAWSIAYALKSYQEYVERKDKIKWKYKTSDSTVDYDHVFSPAFIYNQINGGRDDGSSPYEALRLVVAKGVAPWNAMPYKEADYKTQPSDDAFKAASKFKGKEILSLKVSELNDFKNQLSMGRPVVTGIMVYENFYQMKGKEIYKSAGGKALGGHAITIVGYDDSMGAFKFINSWSEYWGDKGFGYIDYKWFQRMGMGGFVLVDEIDPNITADSGPAETTEPGTDSTANNTKPDAEESDDISPPAEFQASSGNYSKKIVLTWTKVANAVGYEIHRQSPGEKKYSKVGLSHNTSFEDTGVDDETSYNYKLASISADEKISDLTEGYTVGYSKPVKQEVPAKIASITATDGKFYDKISLEWEPLENVTGYQIFRYDGKSKSYKSIGKSDKPAFEDKTAAKNGGSETYTVAGVNKGTTGLISDAVFGRTSKIIKPEPPQNLEATRGVYKDKVALKWKKVPNATSYFVFRYVKNRWEKLKSVNTENFEDATVPKGKVYYAVSAGNKEGFWSSYSKYAFGYCDPNLKRGGTKLDAPREIAAELDKKTKTIRMTWKSVEGSDQNTIWQKKLGEKEWSPITSLNAKDTSYSFPLPGENILYLYAMTSKTELGGEGDKSKPVSIVFSTPKTSGKKRAFGGDSKLERFKGTWTAMQWDGKSQVKNVVLEIEAKDDNTSYTVKLDKKKTFEGKYVQDSPEIEIDGKMKIKLNSSEDGLAVQVKDKAIINEKGELSFLKE